MKLRSALMILAAASLVPLLAFAFVAGALLVDQERERLQRAAMGRSVSAMSAVDGELRGAINTLRVLAASRALETGDLRTFHEQAQRVLATQPGWLNIGLATVERQQLIDAVRPFGEQAPFSAPDVAFEIAARGESAVGDLGQGSAVQGAVLRVRVPVRIDGAVRYVLSAPLRTSVFADILRAQRIDGDSAIVLVDRNGRIIARVPDAPVDTPLPEAVRAQLVSASSGWFRADMRDGTESYAAYARSPLSGWSLALAIPVATVHAAAWRTGAVVAAGAAVALVIALALASLLGRRIETPIASLARATAAMGRGGDVELQDPGRIAEVSQLHHALRDASGAIRQREQLAAREKAALEREQQALRAADTAKDEFIATLSHELRNPLGALAAATHLLKAIRLSDPIAIRAREVVDRQVAQMTRLIEDLLDVSRIAAGKANLSPEVFDLADAMRRTTEGLRAAGRFAQHDVRIDATSVFVRADCTRVEQILCNLIDNALKFTPAGGSIAVAVAREGTDALLRVTDTGEGIEPGALAHIFDLFAQGAPGLARGRSGLGIGLAMVKRLAEMQGGTVVASSAGAGKGSTFVVRIPAIEPARTANAQVAPIVSHGDPAPTRPRRILVIDDNDDLRQMLETSFALDGHSVVTARNGASGLVLAARHVPEVVFVDIGLPDIDGYDVARQLRARPGGTRVRLIAISGYGQSEDRLRAAAAGFDTHLTKPVTPHALQQAIRHDDQASPPATWQPTARPERKPADAE